VQYGVVDLASYLKELTGHETPVVSTPTSAQKVRILVGSKSAQKYAPYDVAAAEFGDEGYLLRATAKDGTTNIVVAGATPRGTTGGLAALMKEIVAEDKSAYLPADLDR